MTFSPIERRRFLQLLSAAGVLAARPGLSQSSEETPSIRKPLIRDVTVGYLLNCNFWALSPYINQADIRLSGWNTDLAGGSIDYSPKNEMTLDWFKLINKGENKAVSICHLLARQSEGMVTLEYRFKLPTRMDGAAWELRDLEDAGVRITTYGPDLCFEDSSGKLERLQSYELGHDYGVKVIADLSTKSCDIYVDGERRAESAPFRRPIGTIDEVLIKTGRAPGELFLGPVNVYKGYSVCESFVTCGIGKLPTDWVADTSGGTVAVQEFLCCSRPDVLSARLENTKPGGSVALRKNFAPLQGKTVLECRFLLTEKADGPGIDLLQGEAPGIQIRARNGDLCVLSAQQQTTKLALNFRSNLWYMLKVIANPTTLTADIFLNGKLAAENVAFTQRIAAFDGIQFSLGNAGHGVMWVDDVFVYPFREYPADYVPEPRPSKATPPYILGVQSAPIHREGVTYVGWDWVDRNRKPALGWYDEGNPEVSDWEIKWQVEHGIDYELYCWYRPNSGFGNPIKNGPCDEAIINGLFNARYSHLKKFAIMYEDQQGNIASWGKSDPDDFKNHIIPYWIEYFFKDPRYLVIDGKPLLSIYSVFSFIENFGGLEGARKALAGLREECVRAGFSGVVVIMENRDAEKDVLKKMKEIGVDYCYAYTWTTREMAEQRALNTAQRDGAKAAGMGMLPMLSVGWETSNWDGPRGPGWLTAPEFKKQALWLKDEFMPTLPSDSLGRRMLMIDNWNEFGEGHWIMPSPLAGFGYLDALREVFTDGVAHEDRVPTQRQQLRFTALYPKD